VSYKESKSKFEVITTQNEENYVCGFATSSFCSGDVLWDGRCSGSETSADIFGVASLQDHQYMPRRGGVCPAPS